MPRSGRPASASFLMASAWAACWLLRVSSALPEVRALTGLNNSCPVAQDILILVDSSASVGQVNFERAKDFVKSLLLKLSMPSVQVGVVRFENTAVEVSSLEGNRSALLGRIDAMDYVVGETSLAPAFQKAAMMLAAGAPGVDRVVLVLTDGKPDDGPTALQRVADLKAASTRVLFAFISAASSPASVIYDMASSPSSSTVFHVGGYEILGAAVDQVSQMIVAPCPCGAGLTVYTSDPQNQPAVLQSFQDLAHGASEVQDCASRFPAYSGNITLTCSDAALTVTQTCSLACTAGMRAGLSLGSLSTTAETSARLASGATETLPCTRVLPGTAGEVTLLCNNGVLTAAHTCEHRCDGSVVVPVVHRNISKPLAVPPDGMDHGSFYSVQCSTLFGSDSSGEIGLLCLSGVAEAFGQCATIPTCEAAPPQEVPAEWRASVAILIGVGVAILLSGFGLMAAALCRHKFHVAPEPPLDPVVPEDPKSFVTLALDSESVFNDRLVKAGIDTDSIKRCMDAGWTTLGQFAFSSSFTPNKSDDSAFLGVCRRIFGEDNHAKVGSLRRIFNEAYTLAAGELHFLQTDPPPVKKLTSVEAQTLPQVLVELVQGNQLELDLVCCIDSSVSVGEENFGKAIAFLERMVRELDMPPVSMGILRFNHNFTEISPLTSDRGALLTSVAAMKFDPGETKLAPPLRHASTMLKTNLDPMSSPHAGQERRKAVVIVSDGDPNDLIESEREAELLKNKGVLVVCVCIGTGNQQAMGRLVSAPADHYLLPLASYKVLLDVAEEVLQRVVDMSLWVRRAKVDVDVDRYEVVADVSMVPGYELMMPGWVQRSCEDWTWMPHKGQCMVDSKVAPWDPNWARQQKALMAPPPPPQKSAADIGVQASVLMSLHDALTDPSGHVAPAQVDGKWLVSEEAAPVREVLAQTTAEADEALLSEGSLSPAARTAVDFRLHLKRALAVQRQSEVAAVEVQTDRYEPEAEVAVQTEPMVKVSLTSWRQAPLDLVICVDSSASFCLSRERGAFIESGTFERARGFVECLASQVHMPEVRLGLLRFEDMHDVICGLTASLDNFRETLQGMMPTAGETKMAPPLWQALAMLGAASSRDPNALQVDSTALSSTARKAVLVVTDGDPNDPMETEKAAHALRANGVQLVFVHIKKARGEMDGEDIGAALHRLAAPTSGRGVFGCTDDERALTALVPEVLKQLLMVQRRISRARCAIPLTPYEEVVGDLDEVDGVEILLPDAPMLDSCVVAWDPKESPRSRTEKRVPEETRRDLERRLEKAELEAQRVSAELHAQEAAAATQAMEADLMLQAALRRAEAAERCQDTRAIEAERQLRTVTDRMGVAQKEMEETLQASGMQERLATQRMKDMEKQNDELSASLRQLKAELEALRARESTLVEREILVQSRSSAADQQLEVLRLRLEQVEMENANLKETQHAAWNIEGAEKDQGDLQRSLLIAEGALEAVRMRESDLKEHSQAVGSAASALAYVVAKAIGWNVSAGVTQQKQSAFFTTSTTSQQKQSASLNTSTSFDGAEVSTRAATSPKSTGRGFDFRVAHSGSPACPEPFGEPTPSSTIHGETGGKMPRPASAGSSRQGYDDLSEQMDWLRAQLEEHDGDLIRSFHRLDDTCSKSLTLTKMIGGLAELGITRSQAQTIFRRLAHLSNSEKRGSLSLQDWLTAFDKATNTRYMTADEIANSSRISPTDDSVGQGFDR